MLQEEIWTLYVKCKGQDSWNSPLNGIFCRVYPLATLRHKHMSYCTWSVELPPPPHTHTYTKWESKQRITDGNSLVRCWNILEERSDWLGCNYVIKYRRGGSNWWKKIFPKAFFFFFSIFVWLEAVRTEVHTGQPISLFLKINNWTNIEFSKLWMAYVTLFSSLKQVFYEPTNIPDKY